MLKNITNFQDALEVLSVLKAKGDTRFVGGCVRNALLGLPVNDIDLATTLLPDQVEQVFKNLGIKTIDIGKAHGTIIAVVKGHQYEITTLRKDVSTDGRRAIVAFSNSWEEDALRRDFTINAMSYCPHEDKLYDYFGGKSDLHTGQIKFVGVPEERVKEDYLRIMRLFRFYTYYGKSIDSASLRACIKFANKLDQISAERKHNEIQKILEHPRYAESIDLMLKNTVLNHIFGERISEEIIPLFKELDDFEYKPILAYLFKLFVILYKSQISIKDLDNSLKLTNKEKQYINELLRIAKTPASKIKAGLYEFIYGNQYCLDSMIFLFLDKIVDLSFVKMAHSYHGKKLRLPLDGEDIKRQFSIKEGQEVGRLLRLATKYWCKSEYSSTKDDLLLYLGETK